MASPWKMRRPARSVAPAAGQGNLISGNAGNGIHVFGSTASGNDLSGQYDRYRCDREPRCCPTRASGSRSRARPGNLVQADLISGNAQGGVQITGLGAGGNSIFGCTIGTDRAGEFALGNGLASLNNGIGVFINGAGGNQVGGASARPGQPDLGQRHGRCLHLRPLRLGQHGARQPDRHRRHGPAAHLPERFHASASRSEF